MPSPFRSPKTLPEWIELDYYDRPRWIRMMRASIRMAVERFSSDRMIMEYFERLYTQDTPSTTRPGW